MSLQEALKDRQKAVIQMQNKRLDLNQFISSSFSSCGGLFAEERWKYAKQQQKSE